MLARTHARRGTGALANKNRAGGCSLLQPPGDVDRIAADEGASCTSVPDDHVACVDPDPQLKLPREQLRQPALHRERGMECTLGVVLKRVRCAEGGHHRVTDELLDRPADALD